jgi:hypothetical protein
MIKKKLNIRTINFFFNKQNINKTENEYNLSKLIKKKKRKNKNKNKKKK